MDRREEERTVLHTVNSNIAQSRCTVILHVGIW
jgi:hypothetical protein